MLGRKSSKSDVLERATSQLRGERVPSRNSTEEDELQAYLNQVAKKTGGTSKENKKTITVDGSDFSISEEDFRLKNEPMSSGPSKYLKSKPKATKAKSMPKTQNLSQQKGFKNSSNLSTLSKAAALTNSFKNKSAKPAISDSDFDVTISTDDSVLRELNMSKPKAQARPKTAHAQRPQESPGKPKLSKQTPPVSVPWSHSFDKSDDDSLGKGSRRFLKKKAPKGTENMSSGLHVSSSTSMVDGPGGSPGATKKLRFNLEKGKPSSPERKSSDLPLKPALKTSSSFRSSQDTDDFTDNVVNVASSNSSIVSGEQRLGRGSRRYIKKAEILTVSPPGENDADDVESDESYKVNLVMDIDSIDPSYTVLHPVAASGARSRSPDRPKTAHRSRPKSPESKRTKSPDSKRTKSPDSKRTKSPESKRPKSPDSKRTKSPESKRTKRRTSSPDPFRKRRTPSPDKNRRPVSPDRKKTRTPSPDPFRKQRTSPDPFRKQRTSPDPFRKRRTSSPEPVSKKRPKSPQQKRSKSEEHKRKKDKKKNENDFFSSMGLQTVDDLLGRKSDSESEIQPKARKSSSKTKRNDPDEYLHSFGLQTVEDLLDRAPVQSEEESISMEIPFKSEHSEILSEYEVRLGEKRSGTAGRQDSIAYSEDFESSTSEIITMQSGKTSRTSRQYSEDFESVTESESETLRDDSQASSYTHTSENSYSSRGSDASYTRSVEIVRRRRSVVEVEVQTMDMGGLNYQWNQAMGQAYASQAYGLGYTDPTPIASHVVSPDALEALTAYSPCVLALNDMLRQQLALTQQFIANQNRVYHSLVSSVSNDHRYTTLEDTRQYIEENRKPRLAFDDALRMVREEMDERR